MSSAKNSRKWLAIYPSGSSLGMSKDMLINSPFSDFLIPGVFLLVVIGIGSLLGVEASFLRYRFAGEVAVGLGTFLILWIVTQAWWMGVHWLHILYITLGIVELVLGLMWRKPLTGIKLMSRICRTHVIK